MASASSQITPTTTTDTTTDTTTTTDNPPLTKRQLKRKLKGERWEATRAVRRQAERVHRKELKRERWERLEALKREWRAEGADDEEVMRREQAHRERTPGMNRAPRRPRAEVEAAIRSGIRLVIDCQYDGVSREEEASKLAKQIGHAYGANLGAAKPFRLGLTSFTAGSQVHERLSRQSGLSRWLLDTTDEPVHQHYSKEEIVYLSSESEAPLQSLDPAKVYVIGGLVDHNRLKGLTARTCEELGLTTARLPIDEHLAARETRQVLTVVTVVDLLLEFNSTQSWATALEKVIPARKGFVVDNATAAAVVGEGGDDDKKE